MTNWKKYENINSVTNKKREKEHKFSDHWLNSIKRSCKKTYAISGEKPISSNWSSMDILNRLQVKNEKNLPQRSVVPLHSNVS